MTSPASDTDDSGTMQLGIAGGSGGCAFIDPMTHTWARNLSAGTYKLGVASTMGTDGAVGVVVTIADAVCGNGHPPLLLPPRPG